MCFKEEEYVGHLLVHWQWFFTLLWFLSLSLMGFSWVTWVQQYDVEDVLLACLEEKDEEYVDFWRKMVLLAIWWAT